MDPRDFSGRFWREWDVEFDYWFRCPARDGCGKRKFLNCRSLIEVPGDLISARFENLRFPNPIALAYNWYSENANEKYIRFCMHCRSV
jgi:hypothetical protein